MTPFTLACGTLIGFILGIGLGTYTHPTVSVGWWITSGAVILLARHKPFLFICAGLIIGFTYVRTWRAQYQVTPPPELERAEGWISEAPDIRSEKTFYTVQLSSPHAGRILVKTDRFPRHHYGEWVSISGTIEAPEAFNGFNYPQFLERAHIFGIMNRGSLQTLDKPDRRTLRTPFYAFRERVERSIQKYVPEPESSFLGGILLGSKRAIPENIQESLRTTGTSHIVAISGANITIMLGIILTWLPLKGRWSPVWATLAIGGGMSILTGGSASVVRGAAVAVAGRIVSACGRRAWPLPLILIAMTVMLLANPLYLTSDPGFQLSFTAFAGLMFIGPSVTRLAEKLTWLPSAMKSALAETTAATVGTAPLSITGFGQLSLLGLVVNPLVLWLLPAITALGLLYVVFAWSPLVHVITIPLWLLLHLALQIIVWFGRFEFATIRLQ